MATTSDLKVGIFIRFNNDLFAVEEVQHRTPGNLRAFFQVKMRSVANGRILENRFRSGEEFILVRVEREKFSIYLSRWAKLPFYGSGIIRTNSG